ncbi:hypothetical protein C2857_006461 [Epichloe festucae Fl1]|uniref:SSCRP protein n=1 Tax=Epichloe festucae (strain Fl1) TaxID=877507 RepID=A0A7S9KTI1_EPIFF|nr:hypothetical protein C2857_006461 [Epichloe festucae Fl1]
MRLSTIAALASAAAVSATPIEKREVGGVLLCTGVNATGACKHQVYPLNQCQQLEKPFYQNTSTFAVDGEDFECNPRLVDCGVICTSPTGCTFGAVDFNYKNKWNLGAIGWDKYITSFDCHLKTRK